MRLDAAASSVIGSLKRIEKNRIFNDRMPQPLIHLNGCPETERNRKIKKETLKYGNN